MKHLVKILSLAAAIAVAPLAYAIPITGTIGFGGNGTYNMTSGQFTPGGPTFTGTNAYVTTSGTGTLAFFTAPNAATFSAFNTNSIGGGALVFTTTQGTRTLTFTLTAFGLDGSNPAGDGFSGTGLLTETGYDNTAASFTLNTNSLGGTFITFNTAAIAATPEPSSLVLLGSGLVSAAGMLIRRRRLA